jgi:hypothetical protein
LRSSYLAYSPALAPRSDPAADGGRLAEPRRAARDRVPSMPGGVGGVASRDVPLSRLTERARCYACPGGTAPRPCPAGLLPRFFRLIIGGRSAPPAASPLQPDFLDQASVTLCRSRFFGATRHSHRLPVAVRGGGHGVGSGDAPRRPGSHVTRRWRETDSNRWSLAARPAFGRRAKKASSGSSTPSTRLGPQGDRGAKPCSPFTRVQSLTSPQRRTVG